ncbi:MAG: ilvH 1 [Mucilaginibacter sp.]|nr:ilvH 1 [Mucilaginibacter sp.]
MKKPSNTHPQTIFAIYAEDKKGLIGQVLIYFNRKSYDVSSLNVALTDISDLVLITLEAMIPANQLKRFTERLKKIIEVYAITTYDARHCLKKTGFYRLAIPALNNALWQLIGTYGAGLSSMGTDTFVISKTGSDEDLQQLYARLEGPHLLGFCKAG